MIPVKVESASSWTEELVTATRLRNGYRYIHIPLNGSQQISVILLHDHATLVKVESVSSWTEELVTATRLRNSYREVIKLNFMCRTQPAMSFTLQCLSEFKSLVHPYSSYGSQQISVILLHDHATHATPGENRVID
ncbi:hypothetical protein DY000_02049418 [Brassica cretica]|uniref:Uncharacterized protein n=1 Tax=Brassica cretica TaxID=69181 RepID=A0ABQ7ERU1_BRACR|nr:hypothetical protein DY000_02049418 [Brassica cretica]